MGKYNSSIWTVQALIDESTWIKTSIGIGKSASTRYSHYSENTIIAMLQMITGKHNK